MEIISEGMPSTAPAPQSLPRFADGTINMQELIRSMAEMLTNEIMSAEDGWRHVLGLDVVDTESHD